MTHPDRELLTQLALNDPLALDADALVHIADCDQCSAEVAALERAVAATEILRDDPTLRDVIAPPDHVWERIAVNAGVSGAASHASGQGSGVGVPNQADASTDWLFTDEETTLDAAPAVAPVTGVQGGPHVRRRRFSAQLLAAAVVGILVGALFTWAIAGRDDDSEPGTNGGETTFTTSDLVGIDGHTTSGVASFADSSSGGELTIELTPEDVGDGFIQAWLLDEDTGGMVALGVIDGDSGTFAVPKDLDLAAFNQIDISLEPYDGDPQHSAVSLARGPLP